MRAKLWYSLFVLATASIQPGYTAEPPIGFRPRSMAYILQPDSFEKSRSKAVTRLAGCSRDLVVLDAFFEAGSPWTPGELKTIRSGKAERRVVAYLSIGEAEDYRAYWHKEWATGGKVTSQAPSFLCAQDPDWKGNFKVRYWQPAWQKLILEQVDQIVSQGFDGVYLDIVDGFEFFEEEHGQYLDHRKNPETGNEYRRDMINWITAIAQRGRKDRTNFLIIPQNGSQLAEQADFISTIDAIGIEDLFTNGNKRQPKSHTKEVLSDLAKLTQAGKPVLMIEYPKLAAVQGLVIQAAQTNGFTLLITDRPLTTLGKSGELAPGIP